MSLAAVLLAGCATDSARHKSAAGAATAPATDTPAAPTTDINRAAADELALLPGVGPSLAARIVEHRARHGKFRRPEHLIAVRGMSERRFREIKHLITAKP